MENYDDIITDNELRGMLNLFLTEEDHGQSAWHEKLIDMEAKIIFSGSPLVIPALAQEQALMSKLNKKFASKTGLKWLFTGIGIATVTACLTLGNSGQPSKQTLIPAVPEHIQQAEDTPQLIAPKAMLPDPETGIPVVPVPDVPHVPEPPALFSETHTPFYQYPETEQTEKQVAYRSIPIPGDSGVFYNRTSGKDGVKIDTIFKGIRRLEVNSIIGDIEVNAVNTDILKIKGDITVKKKGIVLDKPDYKILYERSGDILKIWVENLMKSKNTFVAGSLIVSGSLHFEVPEKTDVVLKNRSGDIRVKGLTGNVCEVTGHYGNLVLSDITTNLKVKAVSGNMDMQNISGNIDATANYGNQAFKNITGQIKTHCISGNITLNEVTGGLDVVSNYGNIVMGHIKGDVKIKNTSGALDGNYIEGNQLDVTSGYGNIKLTTVKSNIQIDSRSGDVSLIAVIGKVSVKSSYGNQQLSGIDGDISSVSNSGDVNLKTCNGDMDLQVGYGNTDIKDCKGDLKIRSRSGDITGNNVELLKSMELKASYGNIKMNLHNRMDELNFKLETLSGRMQVNKDGTQQSSDKGKLELGAGQINIIGVTNSGDQLYY